MGWKEVLPNIFSWSHFSPEKGYLFNGYYVVTKEGAFLIDPPIPSAKVWREIAKRQPPKAIYLTNKDHTRRSVEFREKYLAPIWIHEADRPLADAPIDHIYTDGETLHGGFQVIHLSHSKSPGESAFWLPWEKGVIFLGDALIGHPTGELHLLPPPKIPNPIQAKQGLKKLLHYSFDALLVGDGESIVEGGKQALTKFLARVG